MSRYLESAAPRNDEAGTPRNVESGAITSEVGRQVDVAATVTAVTQGDFEDHPLNITVAATVTVFDNITGAPIHYNESGRTVNVAVTFAVIDRGASFIDNAAVTATATISLLERRGDEESTQVVVLAAVTLTTDDATLHDHLTVTVAATVTVMTGDAPDLHPRDLVHRERGPLVYRESQLVAHRE